MIRHDREEEEEEEGKKPPAKKTNMYYFITASTLTFDKHLERILKQDDLDAVQLSMLSGLTLHRD